MSVRSFHPAARRLDSPAYADLGRGGPQGCAASAGLGGGKPQGFSAAAGLERGASQGFTGHEVHLTPSPAAAHRSTPFALSLSKGSRTHRFSSPRAQADRPRRPGNTHPLRSPPRGPAASPASPSRMSTAIACHTPASHRP